MTKYQTKYLIDCYLDDPFNQMIDLDHIGILYRRDHDGKMIIFKELKDDVNIKSIKNDVNDSRSFRNTISRRILFI